MMNVCFYCSTEDEADGWEFEIEVREAEQRSTEANKLRNRLLKQIERDICLRYMRMYTLADLGRREKDRIKAAAVIKVIRSMISEVCGRCAEKLPALEKEKREEVMELMDTYEDGAGKTVIQTPEKMRVWKSR